MAACAPRLACTALCNRCCAYSQLRSGQWVTAAIRVAAEQSEQRFARYPLLIAGRVRQLTKKRCMRVLAFVCCERAAATPCARLVDRRFAMVCGRQPCRAQLRAPTDVLVRATPAPSHLRPLAMLSRSRRRGVPLSALERAILCALRLPQDLRHCQPAVLYGPPAQQTQHVAANGNLARVAEPDGSCDLLPLRPCGACWFRDAPRIGCCG